MTDIGSIVTYRLNAEDAAQINRRRADFDATRYSAMDRWPRGAQAHLGNEAHQGEVYPAVVVRNWGDGPLNLKVLLDGNDDLWAPSRTQGYGDGEWLPMGELR